MYAKILVAYDGSKAAKRALTQAIKISKSFGSKLEVIHVFSLSGFQIGEALIPVPHHYADDFYGYSEKILDEARAQISEVPGARAILLQGQPARTILEYAEDSNCDLIVVGSRGLGAIRELVLGSVSHNVVQHAKVPILVVK